MKIGSTLISSFCSFRFNRICFLLLSFFCLSKIKVYGQTGCNPISTMNCDQLQVSLPFNLSFDNSVTGTIADKNGSGTGFTLVDAYSGIRLTQDGTPSNSNIPGYEPSKLTLSNGRLQIQTNKGIAYTNNNNQINALSVKVDSRAPLIIETTIINPFYGGASQQGGLWFGLNDKTFLKLVAVGNTIELRREINDICNNNATDQRITGTITDLNLKTVRLRMSVNPSTNTAEGFYSIDGINYINVGATYATKTLSIAGMGLTTSTAYAGIFATHRNATSSITYTFENFSLNQPNTGNTAPQFSSDNYNYSLQDNVALETLVGKVSASDANGDVISYSILSGNTNGAFTINSSTGEIKVAKYLNYHTQSSYSLKLRASDPGNLSNDANVTINVSLGNIPPSFNAINWGTAASQPIATHEVHGVTVNGKIYIFGGYDVQKQPNWTPTKRSYVYDPALNQWSQIADMPHTPNGTNFGGVTHEGVTTDGTDIYFAGGYTSNSTGNGQLFGTKQVWKYNVATNTYSALPNLPQELAAGQLQYLKGKIHYMGGANLSRADVAIHYALDLDNLAAGWQTMAPLSDARNHPGSAVLEGKIYFIGGSHHQDGSAVTQKIVEAYDQNTNTWTRVADMPIGLDHISSSVTVLGNQIFVLGGETAHNVRSSRVLSYTSARNTWIDYTALPSVRSAGVAVALKGAIHYTGGNFTTTNYKGILTNVASQQVTSFVLINADTDQPIQTLTNGSTLNLATLPTRNLNIQAITFPSSVGSVVFNLSGAVTKNVTESVAPYALYADNNSGNFYAWTPPTGSYTLKGTPYTASGGSGTAGIGLTVNFTVIDQNPVTSTSLSNSLVMMHPNPSNGQDVNLSIQNLGNQEKVTLRLIDMAGRIMEIKNLETSTEGTINTVISRGKKMTTGIYILQIQTSSGTLHRQLLVK